MRIAFPSLSGLRAVLAAALAVTALAGGAASAAYPDRPITLVVGWLGA